ncbi:coiled-coil domain containing protein 151 [Leptinotarsa decemlineata]|uniref:coiled-coil domain containing protein 151 n=1 Tax=Leptinotarsa decemlineata TaxID=7539 RepID=UPI003D30AE73
MNAKSGQDQSEKLSELNKKILEVKKKIQLSEGQRKALFEDCEAERKSNADQILKLKKDISQLIIVLHESTTPVAKHSIQNRLLESIVGPLEKKSCTEVRELLDLQIIDKTKKIDLLRYKTKQRKKYLAELATKYQKLLGEQEKKELNKKVEQPVKKATCELQNSIHAIDVQIREAIHVKNRYADIQKSLKEDSDNFESKINKLEEELNTQVNDIQKLQTIMDEATRMRCIARGNLLKEEKTVNCAAASREKEATEGRRLVNERKTELERLEKKIFQNGKIPLRPEPEGAEDTVPENDKSPTPPHPVESMSQAFEILKHATGGTSTEDVLKRFESQKKTEQRLTFLRSKGEEEKRKLENILENLGRKLDSFKYVEVKDAERKSGEMEEMKKEIEKNRERSAICREEMAKKCEVLESVKTGLQSLYLSINPLAVPQSDGLIILQQINENLLSIFEKTGDEDILIGTDEKVQGIDSLEEKWLPAPYTGLIKKTPLPQPGTSPAPPPPPGSEDEEEVPSRGYLKRQAQLVVDAKSRRKNVRIQIPKRN